MRCLVIKKLLKGSTGAKHNKSSITVCQTNVVVLIKIWLPNSNIGFLRICGNEKMEKCLEFRVNGQKS